MKKFPPHHPQAPLLPSECARGAALTARGAKGCSRRLAFPPDRSEVPGRVGRDGNLYSNRHVCCSHVRQSRLGRDYLPGLEEGVPRDFWVSLPRSCRGQQGLPAVPCQPRGCPHRAPRSRASRGRQGGREGGKKGGRGAGRRGLQQHNGNGEGDETGSACVQGGRVG